jgi:hypothetical protein
MMETRVFNPNYNSSVKLEKTSRLIFKEPEVKFVHSEEVYIETRDDQGENALKVGATKNPVYL